VTVLDPTAPMVTSNEVPIQDWSVVHFVIYFLLAVLWIVRCVLHGKLNRSKYGGISIFWSRRLFLFFSLSLSMSCILFDNFFMLNFFEVLCILDLHVNGHPRIVAEHECNLWNSFVFRSLYSSCLLPY
jgi:hypothetical protein